ncbi:MAG: hypothetical protein KC933_19425, partial [Myxococcales bacterium]|nr:hypothetical protein [Myxococcales bacterium]
MRRRWLLWGVLMHGCVTPPPPDPAAGAPAPPRGDVVLLVGGAAPAPEAGPITAVVVKDGRLAALGEAEALAPWIGPETRVIRMSRGVVMPGL